MENTIYIALSRQMELRRQMGVISHNLANMNTPAYKSEKMVFVEYLSKAKTGFDRLENGSGDGRYAFVRAGGQARNLSEGPMNNTGNDLDVGISGEGYFVVETEQGKRYTRHGRFQLNQNSELTNSQGDVVQSIGGGSITIPVEATKISIATDGTVANGDETIGQIALVTFDDQQKLKREPNNLYTTDQAEKPAEKSNIIQGMLEQSNVNAIIEMTQMINIHRSHDSVKRMIDDEHKRIERTVNRLGRPSQGN